MCVVKDSPDSQLFNHPGALTKLALWIGEALSEQEKDTTGKLAHGGRGTPLVVASLDEKRGVYVVVGTGGGGGPDSVFVDRESAKKKAKEKEEKETARKARENVREEKRVAKREAKRKEKEEKRKQKEARDGDDEGEDEEEDDSESEEESEDSEESDDEEADDEDESKEKGYGLNRFGTAFQDVVGETNARVRIDSFEHCVVEVKKEDLGGFLESLSMKAVVG